MHLFQSTKDYVLTGVLRSAAVLCAFVLVLVLLFVVRESMPALSDIGAARFVTDASWHPDGGTAATYGLLPMLAGSLALTAGAVLLAAPLGLSCALFCTDFAAPALAAAVRRMIELVAGVPSVVYGLWGLSVLVPIINRWEPPGPSLLAGVLVLTLMILPTIALLAETAIAAVPRGYRSGALALGMTRFTTLFGVVLPAARSGLFAAVLLGVCRAIGETMAVLMVCGNIVRYPQGLFSPMRALTANIALEMGYALDVHRSALFVGGLILTIMVIALVLAMERVGPRGESP